MLSMSSVISNGTIKLIGRLVVRLLANFNKTSCVILPSELRCRSMILANFRSDLGVVSTRITFIGGDCFVVTLD
ncbi:unnamed protein product [Dracunculus medinensis]|uniref:Secreted protein n=1 Tax=Dracunculus medinensis TaxID=318479 RepID=A0A0N4U8T5_DRAME|nr:unnamed protein product [Dracunculus medinensis]